MSSETNTKRSPWYWVPSLYYAEGIPYVVVMLVSVIMYKRMGISNTDIALYTSWLYLPWVIKPLWSPVVDILRTKKFWIVTMELIIGAALGSVALTIPLSNFFRVTLAFFWLLAFSSATHDIACDGFYMLGLSKHDQAWFVGIRSTFYRLAMITGQGLLIILAGYLESSTGLNDVSVAIQAVSPKTVVVSTVSESDDAADGSLRILSEPATLQIPIQLLSTEQADSVLKAARAENVRNGYSEDPKVLAKEERARVQNESSLKRGLESFLRTHFGENQNPVQGLKKAGNLGVVRFHLSGAPEPGKEIVVNFGRRSGDKNISLIEGTRFVFTDQNWNIPALAVFQLDNKLKVPVSADYAATAGNIPLSWSITFIILAVLFIMFFLYHRFTLPSVEEPGETAELKSLFSEFFTTFKLFFTKEKVWVSIAFLLLYRLGESQLVKLASPFLLDAQEAGGLGLTTGQVGFVYGTVGILMLTLGGILGGIFASRQGLKYWIWWMALAINLPDAVYIYLSYALPDNFFMVNVAVAIEQFGYGFGFTAYMLYMIAMADGEYKTAHFAIATAFMALGMMIPGMWSGWLQELIGYRHFFVWVVIATIPSFLMLKFIPIDPEFGKKTEN